MRLEDLTGLTDEEDEDTTFDEELYILSYIIIYIRHGQGGVSQKNPCHRKNWQNPPSCPAKADPPIRRALRAGKFFSGFLRDF